MFSGDRRIVFWQLLIGLLCGPMLLLGPMPGYAQMISINSGHMPGLNPAFVTYLAEKAKSNDIKMPQMADGHFLGHIPPPFRFPPPAAPVVSAKEAAAFPAKFDLRTTSPVGVTEVRDQVYCGSCWAFGAMASLESYFKYKKHVTVNLSEADLNENHMGDWAVCMGGNGQLAAAYMARWGGPVSEAKVPYPYWVQEQGLAATPWDAAAATGPMGATPGVPDAYHVQNVYFLPQSAKPLSLADMNTLKQALQDNGAVAVAYYMDNSYYNDVNHSYYCTDTGLGTNHEVAIVGWDDNYSSTKFTPAATGNGAWIVKNSWGTGWGESGYFYMSYYDNSLELDAQFYNAEPVTNYTRVYQHDPLGMVSFMDFWSSNDAWYANDFMASASAKTIKAVSIWTPVVNTTYTIYIYSNVNITPYTFVAPTSGTLVATKSGTIAKPGYSTIKLTTPKAVMANRPFTVVVHVNTPGYAYSTPVAYPLSGYSTAETACPGQSFLSPDGTDWYFANDYNMSVKVFAGP